MAQEVTAAKDKDTKEVEEGKIYAFFGYWGILCLIPLLAKRDNHFALHHGKQGLVHFIALLILIPLSLIPIIGWFVIGPLGGMALLVLNIIGMVQSLSGAYWKSPLLGDLAAKMKI